MNGLVKGAQKLATKVEEAWQLARELNNPEALARIGRVFQEASAQNPAYFATGRELPTGMNAMNAAEFLNQKHRNPYTGFSPDLETTQGGTVLMARDGAEMRRTGRALDNYNLRGSIKRGRGGIGADSDVYEIDTLALGTNAAGKQLYPALWDFVLSRPDAVNEATALSQSNQFRRNVNMAPLYEKYGEQANRIIPSPDQFTMSGGPEGERMVAQFQKLPVDAQIGALNARIAHGASKEVQRIAERLARMSPGGPPELRRHLDEARSLGIDPGAPWQPTTDVDADFFPRLTRWLRATADATQTGSRVGDSSLRRAAIATDALRGLEAGDIQGQRYLTQRLGRRQGGSVPPRVA